MFELLEFIQSHILYLALLLGTGVLAGFLNTLACGGSLLTLPMLIFLMDLPGLADALPAADDAAEDKDVTPYANGTNRVAILFQNLSAILGFRNKGISNFRYAIVLAIPAVAGAAIGAVLATQTGDKVFEPILAVVLVSMLFLTLFNPTEWLHDKINPGDTHHKIITGIVLFFIGIYGGFIQAGTGLLIIAALRIIDGDDLVITNSLKVFIIFAYTIIALGIFISKGQIVWILGITLAIGNATGAWIGSHWAVAKGEKWIKVVLVVTVLAYSINLFLKPFGLDVVSLLGVG